MPCWLTHNVRHAPLRVDDLEQNFGEFLSDVLSAFGQKRSPSVVRAALDAAVADAEQRDAPWVEYAEAIDAQLAEVARAVGKTSKVWMEEHRKFRELVAPVRALSEAVELQVGSLANVSEVLWSLSETAPRPPPRASPYTRLTDRGVSPEI